jgi:pimeloyl-CoA synthetase
MKYVKVKDKDNLLRDTTSNGIVNSDEESYKQYVENYKRQLNSTKKVDFLQQQVDEIKNDVSEIKDLLLKLINVK